MLSDMQEQKCGKWGCGRKADYKVHGDLLYYTCAEHHEEIRKLTEGE